MTAAPDHDHMGAALALARRGLGWVAPNPAVGCVLVQGGGVVGRGWTQPGGRPHAETEALGRAGAAARGATAYVTLEPCSHHGRTPPCADALVAAGISRVVVAIGDPDPRVSGAGIARLREAGILVETGCRAAEATELTLGFLTRIRQGRPMVTLKLATTLDGRIALASGESRWITGPAARAMGHMLRADHDAIMVGAGTVRTDDPALTCRLPGLEERSPRRIVVGGRSSQFSGTALGRATPDAAVWWAIPGRDRPRPAAGVEPLPISPASDGRVDLAALLQELGRRGVTRLLVEGGATLAAAMLAAGLVDRLVWFRSCGLIGGDGISAVGPLDLTRLADMPVLRLLDRREAGDDVVESYAVGAPDLCAGCTDVFTDCGSTAMFTGIITDQGRVRAILPAGDTRFEIDTAYDTAGIDLGASIACSGACLTVVEKGPGWFAVQASAETLRCTTLGDWTAGTILNLERALKVGDELGGHIVSGHVDGVGQIVSRSAEGESTRYLIAVPAELQRFVAPKGSIAVDGVSLTVNEVDGAHFAVNIIPHTQSWTTFGAAQPGRRVNLEIDMLARYVARMLDPTLGRR